MSDKLEFRPTDDAWVSILEKLCGSRIQISMVLTGGGTGAISHCLRRSGASLNFLEAVVPYSRTATQEYLGFKPREGYASPRTAKALAQTAHRRAASLSEKPHLVFGIALTAALPTNASNPEPSSSQDCQIHVASKSPHTCRGWSLYFAGHPSEREVSEAIADQMFLIAIQNALQQSGLAIDSDPTQPLHAAGLTLTMTDNHGL
ncbi:MAG: hypothetical protein ACPHF4_02635 [Rubripirellula sp.]